MKRREALAVIAATGAAASLHGAFASSAIAKTDALEIHLTDAQWRTRLKPEQYAILREHGTEPPFSSPLDSEKRRGIYFCAGCSLPLFSSQTKFDSGTGWPSFYAPMKNAVRTSPDNAFFAARTEVHCRRCAGHLGHVFNDGPRPTGLRYCMDGLALTFKPD